MILYHGTSEASARAALKEGLKPRSETGANNWEHSIASRSDCVYLTRLYAGYFAHSATNEGEHWAVLAIDTDKLNQKLLLPDEDFLGQLEVRRAQAKGKALQLNLHELTLWYREHLEEFQPQWEKSVQFLGNCCYQGHISRRAIVEAVVWDWRQNPSMALQFADPSITIENAVYVGRKYEALTAWLMGGELGHKEWMLASFGTELPAGFVPAAQVESQKEMLLNRKGWKKIKGPKGGKK